MKQTEKLQQGKYESIWFAAINCEFLPFWDGESDSPRSLPANPLKDEKFIAKRIVHVIAKLFGKCAQQSRFLLRSKEYYPHTQNRRRAWAKFQTA